MRRMTLFCLMISCMFIGTATFANQTAPLAGQYVDGKFYVEPGTVHVAPNGIFLNVDGNFISVEAICMDACRVYAIGYDTMRMVTCRKCGIKYNADRFSDRCPHTGEKVRHTS